MGDSTQFTLHNDANSVPYCNVEEALRGFPEERPPQFPVLVLLKKRHVRPQAPVALAEQEGDDVPEHAREERPAQQVKRALWRQAADFSGDLANASVREQSQIDELIRGPFACFLISEMDEVELQRDDIGFVLRAGVVSFASNLKKGSNVYWEKIGSKLSSKMKKNIENRCRNQNPKTTWKSLLVEKWDGVFQKRGLYEEAIKRFNDHCKACDSKCRRRLEPEPTSAVETDASCMAAELEEFYQQHYHGVTTANAPVIAQESAVYDEEEDDMFLGASV